MSNKHCINDYPGEADEIKQRYIPTFVHQPIFQSQSEKDQRIRFTPTFYSTALDTDGYNIKTIHHMKQKNNNSRSNIFKQTVPYSNYSHQRRIQALNPKSRVFYSSKDKWYDHTKEDLYSSIRNHNDYCSSKQRKILQQTSASVFTDITYGIKPKTNLIDQCISKKLLKVSENPQSLIPKSQNVNLNKELTQVNQDKGKIDKTVILNQKQMGNSKQGNSKKKINVQSTKKDFHKNCVPENSQFQTQNSKNAMIRSQCLQKSKLVSRNPTFTLVRGNKISNRL